MRRAYTTASVVLVALAGCAEGETPSFVGTKTCASCHSAEYAAWEGSHHDRAMEPAVPASVLGDFDDASFTYGSVTSTFFRRGDRYFVRTDASDGSVRDFEVRYTYGVEPLQQYLIELSGGHVQPLSIAWDSRPAPEGGQRWFHLYPGEGVEHSDPLHWTGRQQNWNFTCADCHSTNVRKGYDAEADRFQTTWSEIDVSCEACHGPGSEHRRWASTPGIVRALLWRDAGLTARLDEREDVRWTVDPSSGRPARSVPRETSTEVAVCAQCHSRRAQISEGYVAGAPLDDYYVQSLLMPGLYYPDGQQLDEVYTHGSFLQSRMFHAGVTCSDCHDPHSQELRAPGNQLCGQCHTASRYDAPAHTFHPPGSEGARCVSCHMPETTYMQVDPRRDHSIRVPRPDLSVSLGVPNPCTQCHTDRDAEWAAAEVRSRLGRDAAGFQDFAAAFHADDRRAPGAAVELRRLASRPGGPAIVRASALARLAAHPGRAGRDAAALALADPDVMVRRAALTVLESADPRERIALVAPLLRDSSRAVRIHAAWALADVAPGLGNEADREAFARAAEEFIAAQRSNADRAEIRVTLGNFLVRLGRSGEAAAEYRAAIRLAPGMAAGYLYLAELLRGAGQEPDAERTLREGLTRSPRDASLHHALGLSLARTGRVEAAVAELARAAALEPADAGLAYAYAVALHSSGRAPEAVRVLDAALERHPADRSLLFALATFHRDAGRRREAVEYATRLAEAFPDDVEARQLLRSLREEAEDLP